jgi:hypothetical protein
MRTTTDPQQREILSDIDDLMLNRIRAQLTPDQIEAFDQSRYRYAVSKSLEPLIAKGKEYISPQELTNALSNTKLGKHLMATGNAGGIGDIADVGRRFVPPDTGLSTGDIATLGAGGASLMYAPYVAPSIVGTSYLYNRFGPKIAKFLLKPPG